MTHDTKISRIEIAAYTIPTETPESDGTYEWDKTTMVVVNIAAAGNTGMGYTYADLATAHLIEKSLAEEIRGRDAMAHGEIWTGMVQHIRNLGRPGVSSMGIAAVDNALWDLRAKLLGVSVASLVGLTRPGIMAYGSGGFTSYTARQLIDQMTGWAESGMRAVKMKIGRDAEADIERVKSVRQAIGPKVELFVDANGAYSRKQALLQAYRFAESGHVSWFEEPVPSHDLEGLHLLRDSGPPGMRIAAGEYGYDAYYFRRMLQTEAVDVLQADATRCAGITGFLEADALCQSFGICFSAHTSPSVHVHACCGSKRAINVEYFFDHVRIEKMAFNGAIEAQNGILRPNLSKPGFGLEWRESDMAKYRVYRAEV